MFAKRLQDLTPADIDHVIADQIRESEEIEFKEGLSAKGGFDGWHDGASQVGVRARDEIVREVVAFANAYGGILLLGIKESDDHPHRAVGVRPIPRCADLASRIAMFCRDMVDPQIPVLEIAPIPMEGDAGVVAIRVLSSRRAPHRCKATLECFVRRAERTEALTMREIQDLTLQVERGLQGIEALFQQRALTFEQAMSALGAVLGLRATCIPLSPIDVANVPGEPHNYPQLVRVPAAYPDRRTTELFVPFNVSGWRPILRGARSNQTDERGSSRVELHRDGLIEFAFTFVDRDQLQLYAAWVLGLACNALIAIQKVRKVAAAPGVEYGLELEVFVRGRDRPIGAYGTGYTTWGPLKPPGCKFPRYSVADERAFGPLLDLIQSDFWNAAGYHLGPGEFLIADLSAFLPKPAV